MAYSLQEVTELIDAHIAGTLDVSQQSKLSQYLGNSADARRLYLEYMGLDAALSWTIQGDDASLDANSAERANESLLTHHGRTADGQLSIPDTLHSAEGSLPTLHSRFFWQSSLIAIIFIVLGCGVVYGFFQLLYSSNKQHPILPLASVTAIDRPDSAQVSEDYSWDVIHLDSGTATLSLANVGNVVLEGPIDFQMLSPMRARLSYGRIKVNVTQPTGHGFSVETPDGKVTDLGTEFILGVTPGEKSSLSVLDGKVNLQVASNEISASAAPIELLTQGDGVAFCKGCETERLMSIVTSVDSKFNLPHKLSGESKSRLIVKVKDNKRSTNKYYEIVSEGLQEDVMAFVDMPHEWNGVSKAGIPSYLIGADYVKTFNSKGNMSQDLKVQVTLSKPAKLYVFFNEEFSPPDWLKKTFRNTGDKIGLDEGTRSNNRMRVDVGAGASIDGAFDIWERIITEPGTVTLEGRGDSWPTFYGIAATKLEVKSER